MNEENQTKAQKTCSDNRSGSSVCSGGRASIEEIHAFLGQGWDVREFKFTESDVRQIYPPLDNTKTNVEPVDGCPGVAR
jgi:hypothetical protein